LLIYLIFIVWAQVKFGSYRFDLSYIQGSRLQIRPNTLNLGTHRPGETYQVSVAIQNHGSTPISVVGAVADCQCIATRGLPQTIPPGGSQTLPVTIRFGKAVGEWHQSISYLSDESDQPYPRVDMTARVDDLVLLIPSKSMVNP
jgi:hypothetical protein